VGCACSLSWGAKAVLRFQQKWSSSSREWPSVAVKCHRCRRRCRRRRCRFSIFAFLPFRRRRLLFAFCFFFEKIRRGKCGKCENTGGAALRAGGAAVSLATYYLLLTIYYFSLPGCHSYAVLYVVQRLHGDHRLLSVHTAPALTALYDPLHQCTRAHLSNAFLSY
jgi:hypothetical protein